MGRFLPPVESIKELINTKFDGLEDSDFIFVRDEGIYRHTSHPVIYIDSSYVIRSPLWKGEFQKITSIGGYGDLDHPAIISDDEYDNDIISMCSECEDEVCKKISDDMNLFFNRDVALIASVEGFYAYASDRISSDVDKDLMSAIFQLEERFKEDIDADVINEYNRDEDRYIAYINEEAMLEWLG